MTEDHRENCYQCLKPSFMCYCNDIGLVDNQTALFILQHWREFRKAIGTTQIAMNGFRAIERQFAMGKIAAPKLKPDCVLLYPSPDAVLLSDLDEKPSQMLIIDGTWSHAKVLYRENQWLQALPSVCLVPTEESRYRIRREPKATYLSTIESIVQALQVLEPETENLEVPLQVFDRMIDQQIEMKRLGHEARRLATMG